MTVPKGWKKGLLEEGIQLISGQHVEANKVNTDGIGKPYLTGPADFPDGRIIVTKFTSEGTKFSQKDDLLITVKGSGTGKVIESDGEYAISRQLMAIRPTKFEGRFVFFNLAASISRYEGAAAGLIPGISRDDVLNTPLLIPPHSEQKKISQILSTWDKAITTTEQLLANSQQQKKALMQQLLTGKKRLLDKNGVRFSGEWTSFSLKGICKFIKDGTHGTHIRHESGVPMLSATNITKEGEVDFEGAPFISNEDYEKIHSKYQIESGDILITVVGTLGRVALVQTDSKFTLQRSVAILRIKEKFSVQFMKQIFSAPAFTAILVKKSNSTAQAGVYLGELAKISIRIPIFEEQQKIASVLSTADQEISALQQKLAALKQEKKALMQQLLTGKRRVRVEEAA